MKIHIFSSELEVLEFCDEEMPTPDEIGRIVQENLVRMGVRPWPSVELEAFTYKTGSLIFASPARVFIPAFLTAFTGEK